MKILFRLEKISSDGNAYGHDKIDIVSLNYDGDGSAIAINDDNGTLEHYALVDLEMILFGDPGTGDRWYKLIDTDHPSEDQSRDFTGRIN
jgi:hypothetical protein